MKKLLSTLVVVLLTIGVYAQAEKQSKTTNSSTSTNATPATMQSGNAATMHSNEMMKDCMMMQEGKMMMMKSGKMMPMTADMKCSNGTTIMMNGTVMMSDGKQMMMKNGDCMDMAGNMMKPMDKDKGNSMHQNMNEPKKEADTKQE